MNGLNAQKNPLRNNPYRARWKPFVDAWVTRLIDSDVKKGCSQDDFATEGMYQMIRSTVKQFNSMGFDVYQGGGNVFYVKYDHVSPLVIHARPLAQRTLRLKI